MGILLTRVAKATPKWNVRNGTGRTGGISMSVLSEFFVMSAVELPTRFPGWLAVRAEVSIREVVNPFTGKKTAEKTWLAAVDSVMPAAEPAVPDLGSVTRVAFRGIDHVKLAKLIMLMKGGDFKTRIEQLAQTRVDRARQIRRNGAASDRRRIRGGARGPRRLARRQDRRRMGEDRRNVACSIHGRRLRNRSLRVGKACPRAKLTAEGLYFYWSL